MFSDSMGSPHAEALSGGFTIINTDRPSSARMDIGLNGFYMKTRLMEAQASEISS